MNQNNTEFYSNSLSYSQFRTFITNPWEWQNNRLLWIYDNTTGVSSAVWTVLHKFVEYYLKNWILEDAVMHCYECIYDWSDGKTYIINPDEIDVKKMSFEDIKKHWKTKVVDFKKNWSNQWLLDNIKSWINAFISEQVDYGEILWIEQSMECNAVDILMWTKEVRSPIPFTAISDQICRTNKERVILINWELQTIPVWSIFIEDAKFKDKQTEMNIEEPSYIFQAFFNYYCVKSQYWEAPKFMTFREIKTSKNKDWSSQHQTVTIPFFWETFEEYKIYFWRYILETFERIKIIQDRDFLFNIFSQYDWPKEWEKQKAFYLWVPVWQLKSKIAMSQKNKIASNVPVMWDRDPFKNSKTVKVWTTAEDLHSIEDRIRVAFQNFWVKVSFEKKVDWYSYDQFLFTPARWITMARIKALVPEIIQALEVEKGLRIEAPVLWTKFIWVEIPREEKRFAKLDEFKIKKEKNKPIIPIWTSINSWVETIDLSDPDTSHLIVAWQSWSWKSEFLKTAIQSVKPHWKIIIIDPKKVWLLKVKKQADIYITEIEQISLFLKWVCFEMESAYEILETKDLESIYEYKEKFPKWKVLEDHFIFIDELATISSAIQQIETADKNWNSKIDNYDIWKEIMWYIAKIANLWRAVWYHLIMATQRPSIKVIPWDIKANISCRVCFALATKVDSWVVIDEEWAEQLLGKWDMLFMNRWIKRLQWFYI